MTFVSRLKTAVQSDVFPLRTRPFDAGRPFAFDGGAGRCFGGVLIRFRSARWKRSSMPGSSSGLNSDCRSFRLSGFRSMPQPLRPPYQLNINPETLSQRPELAAQIGIIAALWSRIEMWLGILLGDLLGAEARYGLAMYYAIVSTAARMDTIAAAATERIGKSALIEFESLLRAIRSRSRERNAIVHSNWGISLKHPKAIVAVQTDNQAIRYVSGIFPK